MTERICTGSEREKQKKAASLEEADLRFLWEAVLQGEIHFEANQTRIYLLDLILLTLQIAYTNTSI